jgi:hypothetical protein
VLLLVAMAPWSRLLVGLPPIVANLRARPSGAARRCRRRAATAVVTSPRIPRREGPVIEASINRADLKARGASGVGGLFCGRPRKSQSAFAGPDSPGGGSSVMLSHPWRRGTGTSGRRRRLAPRSAELTSTPSLDRGELAALAVRFSSGQLAPGCRRRTAAPRSGMLRGSERSVGVLME